MRIDSVDFSYLAMLEVTLDADGSQDALVVRVGAGDEVGWGECEASPLTSIAAFVTPRSHGACQPVSAAVLGQRLDGPQDIARIASLVQQGSMDLLQASHTFSGIEMAMWDLLGRRRGVPVWSLLGHRASHGKTPYASLLFGADPQSTFETVREVTAEGFRAVKLGWGGFGEGSVADDRDQLAAAREALGDDGILLVDAGQVWGSDVDRAAARLEVLDEARAEWLEEPFVADDLSSYQALARRAGIKIAGGEASHNKWMARNLIDYGGIGFVQIDCGRIGGIAPATEVARHAAAKGVSYVNHTFTSHLALSASLQPYAGMADHNICEYPVRPRPLAVDLTVNHLTPDSNGEVRAPDAPGLGIEVDQEALARYLVPVEILVAGRELYPARGGRA